MTIDTAETLDLSRLGAPSLVPVDHAAIRKERLDHLAQLWAAERAKDPTLPELDPLTITSSVSVILTEEYAFGDTLLRQAVNDAADALRLATAHGADLQHLAATYANTFPLVLVPGDPTANPPRPPVLEPDAELRQRAQLAPEAFPEFGLTPGGYVYRVRRTFGDRVKGVRALRRAPGYIDLHVLARAGDGTPPAQLLGDIQQAFAGEGDSQASDVVTVLPARIVRYAVRGTLRIRRGPDPEAVKARAVARLQVLAAERHEIGGAVPLRQIEAAALGSPAVAEDISLTGLAADVVGGPSGAPYCTGIVLDHEVM